MQLTVEAALQHAQRRFAPQSESFGLDTQVLLAHVMGTERGWLLAHPEAVLTAQQAEAWETAASRVEAGEALPYVIGEWEFYGLKFTIDHNVLIPRPETELLVEAGVDWLRAHMGARRAADIGTGSGCIAVALVANVPDLHIVAGEFSDAAMEVARANVLRHGVGERVQLVRSDLMAQMPGPFDLICANLPYIPSARLPTLEVSKREPMVALDGGPDGLKYIRPFLQQAAERLASPGLVLAELDASLEAAAIELAQGLWPTAKVAVRKDLAGLPRLLVVEHS